MQTANTNLSGEKSFEPKALTQRDDTQQKLQDLLLPDTPENIRASYLTLAERAKTTEFDLLEEDIVVLDTETTGLSFKTCGLIEISAAKISGREVVERFETFVDPRKPIPPEIVALTHITDEDVAKAPNAQII